MNRRNFLLQLLAGLTLLGSGGNSRAAEFTAQGAATTGRKGGIFRYPAAAAAVGRAYLASRPDLSQTKLVADAGLADCASGQCLRDRVQTRSRRDFSAGNTVLVDGWVLSRAEASACGLVIRQGT